MPALALSLALLLLVAGPARAEIVDGIAAQVGTEIVLVSDVLQAAAPAEERIRAQGGTDTDITALHQEILERMIERALIAQVVRRAELGASEPEVDQAIADIARENQLSPAELRASVEAQGMPFPVYRDRIRSEIEHRKVMGGMVASKVRVDDDEVRAVYDAEFSDQPEGGEEFFLRQILVTPKGEGPGPVRVACAQVGAAVERVAAGESFRDVAAGMTEVNPEAGGAIGWFHESELAPWMKQAVADLQPDDTSGVIETPFGCNAVHVVDRRAHEQITWEQAQPVLTDQLFERKMGTEYKKFIDEIRDKTYIERKGVFAGTGTLDADASAGVDEF